MLVEFERRKIENELVPRETRITLRISLSIVIFDVACGLISSLINRSKYFPESLKNIWWIMDIAAMMMIIIVLAVRKTIYFSPRLIRGEFKLSAILKIWRKIDLWLLLCPVIIILLGVVITIIGVPFSYNWHFFVTAFLLTMILMPIPWKVKDKIRYFEKFVGQWNE